MDSHSRTSKDRRMIPNKRVEIRMIHMAITLEMMKMCIIISLEISGRDKKGSNC